MLGLGLSLNKNPTKSFVGGLDKLKIAEKAKFIFSPYKKLVTDFDGYSVEVRRDSDNQLKDFGFDGLGNLKEQSIVDWVGTGNNGYVRTVYNQKNKDNAIQITNSGQPLIVESGVFIQNGLKFDGINDFMRVNKYSDINILDHPLTIFAQGTMLAADTGYFIGINTDSSNTQYSVWTTTVPQNLNFKLSPAINTVASYTVDEEENILCLYKDGNINAQLTKTNSQENAGNYSAILDSYNFVNIGCRSTANDDSSHAYYINACIKKIIIFDSDEYDNYDNLKDL